MSKTTLPDSETATQSMADWADQVPESVQQCADRYVESLRKFNKAKAARDTAKDNIIQAMHETGCTRCDVDEGSRVLVFDIRNTVSIRKKKADPNTMDDDDSEE